MYALSSPEARDQNFIGPGAFNPGFLGVVGNRLETPHTPMTDSFRKLFMDQQDVNWSWNTDDRNAETASKFRRRESSKPGEAAYHRKLCGAEKVEHGD